MIKQRKIVLIGVMLLLTQINFFCKPANDKRIQENVNSLKLHLGEEFPYKEFLDSTGTLTKIDFTKHDLTIIDFWFKNCPPCLEEMKKFEELMAGKNVVILSLSINSYKEWKNTFTDTSAKYQFLKKAVPNWSHYMMPSDADPKLNNPISADVVQKLTNDLEVSFFPSYFVVDKSGTIVDRPMSAVDYLNKL